MNATNGGGATILVEYRTHFLRASKINMTYERQRTTHCWGKYYKPCLITYMSSCGQSLQRRSGSRRVNGCSEEEARLGYCRNRLEMLLTLYCHTCMYLLVHRLYALKILRMARQMQSHRLGSSKNIPYLYILGFCYFCDEPAANTLTHQDLRLGASTILNFIRHPKLKVFLILVSRINQPVQ